ncbi:hypothetical protein EXIGLDRAFT_237844 [Exidia glandulosa HHB12029]|uniref:Secreted protein n=1 Tax=Exidia glandulosa HHB12029 TaxID=1314781 RepID=A0A165E005_EXIGL|nr:hypothetical protein EXIGLDRAFT_237844 [Exidia glandulosa HHB12029]
MLVVVAFVCSAALGTLLSGLLDADPEPEHLQHRRTRRSQESVMVCRFHPFYTDNPQRSQEHGFERPRGAHDGRENSKQLIWSNTVYIAYRVRATYTRRSNQSDCWRTCRGAPTARGKLFHRPHVHDVARTLNGALGARVALDRRRGGRRHVFRASVSPLRRVARRVVPERAHPTVFGSDAQVGWSSHEP